MKWSPLKDPENGDTNGTLGQANPRTRILWLILGWFCVAIGIAGLILPLLPGVPVLLIALWAFSKSSKRFHDWLYTHKVYGPPLRAWHQHRVITPRAKMAAAGGMTVAVAILVATGASTILIVVVACVMASCAAYVLTRPSYPPRS
jgi:uncharacterized membrane protein YbaN (DUF454 family)